MKCINQQFHFSQNMMYSEKNGTVQTNPLHIDKDYSILSMCNLVILINVQTGLFVKIHLES